MGQPVWVDDDRLNLHYHVRHTALPKPGDLRQLKRMAARIMSQKLDRGKPLWEVWFVEGLENGSCAMISKTHHCMIDGVSGVDLMTVLLSIEPEPSVHDVPAWSPRPAPGAVRLIGDELLRRATQPLDLVRAGSGVLGDPSAACERLSDAVAGLQQTLGAGYGGASHTPLNRTIGGHRRFDWLTLDLDDVKAVKRALGGTVNDVVLATVAGAVGKEQILKVKVAERPSDEVLAKREPGPAAPQTETVKPPDNVLASLRVQMLDAAMQSQLNIPAKTSGVVVSSVEAGSAAESAGLQRGDVIQEVNHEVVKSLEDYQKASAKVKKDEMVVLLLSRQGNNLFVAVNPK